MMNAQYIRLLGPALLLIGAHCMAAGSERHASQASAASGQSLQNATLSTGQVVSGAASVPLSGSAAVGASAGGAAAASAESAEFGRPLPVTDAVITAGPPPDQALKDDAAAEGGKDAK